MVCFKSRGFTLIELMLTLLIAGVVLGIAIPSMSDMIERGHATSIFNNLVGDIAFARSEAVKRGAPIVLCPSSDQSSCSGTDWNKGWLLFVDANDNRAVNNGEEVLRIAGAVKSSISVLMHDFAKSSLSFGGDGKLESGKASDIGRFVVCDSRGEDGAKGLTFSPFGQYRHLSKVEDKDCGS